VLTLLLAVLGPLVFHVDTKTRVGLAYMEPSAKAGAPLPGENARTEATASGVKQSTPQDQGSGMSITNRVWGNRGGTVHAGQFTVVIPVGAFYGQALVTVSQPNPADPRVDLSISPASKNNFLIPVTLSADLFTVTTTQLAGSKVRELDPTSGGWMAMSGQSIDAQSKTVEVPLAHFSSYRVDVPTTGNSAPGPTGRRM